MDPIQMMNHAENIIVVVVIIIIVNSSVIIITINKISIIIMWVLLL